jgi:cation transport protein ChaC
MLTRHTISSGAYFKHFESLPNIWTQEQIETSLAHTMQARPSDARDIWIFAYGSLMWNPMVDFSERKLATLHGWHRSFCLRMVAGRGSEQSPGRMLALEPGGETQGIALKLSSENLDEELRLVWIREMILGSYQPTWARVTLEGGLETHALAFVADKSREQFQRDSRVPTVAPLIGAATGQFGTNAEYLHKLHAALLESGLEDGYIEQLVRLVERLSWQDNPEAPDTV